MMGLMERHPWLWYVAGGVAVRVWEAWDAGKCLPGGVLAAFKPQNLPKSVQQLIGCGGGS